jgi:hypothetical protein
MAEHDADGDRAVPAPVSEAARRLASRWEAGINPLARRISRESFGRLPGYGDLPDDMVDVEIAEAVRQGLRPTPHGYALVLAALAARGLLGTPSQH